MARIDLFGAEPLGIFTPKLSERTSEDRETPVFKTWNRLKQRELRLAVTHPPTNIFEEMILWTEQGKLWKFPINNEQGNWRRLNVCMSVHIFNMQKGSLH